MFQRRYRPEYVVPGRDSPRARAAAQLRLVNSRSIDHLTIETFAHQQNLSTATAARMIADERARRGHESTAERGNDNA